MKCFLVKRFGIIKKNGGLKISFLFLESGKKRHSNAELVEA